MNTETKLLSDTAHQVFGALTDGADAWQQIEVMGLTRIGIPEHLGGSGGTTDQARIVLRAAAYHAARIPLAETLWLAAPILADARMPIPDGPLTIANATGGDLRVHASRDGSSLRLDGTLNRVPWARRATRIVIATDERVCLIEPNTCTITEGENLAGEPRDDIRLDGVTIDTDDVGTLPYRLNLRSRGALARSIQISGAAQRALDHSVEYAGQRTQFGRPIAQFQAVQQHLAQIAGEATILDVSVASATRKAAERPDGSPAIAAARINACRGAGVVAELAHQIHGAIGTTHEHQLRLATTRLWSWREEFGNETEWSRTLGNTATGADDPWHFITAL
ncbi:MULTISPECIES: acyl-CoA dehydrogenase family protein [Rhodococcus]|uniref:Acyl-CoA/acyl-ACP dehydrogenase n=1 Tax=Rhodococcus pseudokoreensis TaxID=2811421 RepID=A0A974W3Y4_9NOCA|nr:MULTISPECIES: acyl-CoA dehydrogenase family protein [Rhodococcus]MBV6760737.1 acyl-CoA/acyl-ACP dehydrogenase [Rhodococcus opacus]QSE89868.1 acyl-CoA/acyl-ACP dehydrogenase [Rhodococcus pseudokoreensis]